MSRWQLDPVHSSVQFSARHMMVTNVHGTFRAFSADVDFDPEHPEDGRVEAVIQAASIDTGMEQRDAHLRSADFLDAEQFPTIVFRSTKVELATGGESRLHGELTIRGETRPVVLQGEFLGVARNLQGRHSERRLHGPCKDQPKGLGPDVERRARGRWLAGRRRGPHRHRPRAPVAGDREGRAGQDARRRRRLNDGRP